MVTGVAALISMPLIGKMSDRVDRFKIFAIATLVAAVVINIYAHYSATAFWLVLVTNVFMMVAIMSRMVPASALTSAIPEPQYRGSFMSINASLQQMAGGFGAMIAGWVIVQKDRYAPLEHYDWLAMIATGTMILTIFLVYRVSKIVQKR